MFLKHGCVGGKRHNGSSWDAWWDFFPGRQFCWTGVGWTLLEIIVSMGIAGVFFLTIYGFYRSNLQVLQAETVRLSVPESSPREIYFLVSDIYAWPALDPSGTEPVKVLSSWW